MKVLVTGGTGFIGSHLIETLIKKQNLVICVAKDRGHCDSFRSTAVTTIICDLNNGVNWKDLLSDVDYVYHLAGITRACNKSEYYDGNALTTGRFVSLCANHAHKLKRFIHVSSLAAAGPALSGDPLTEDCDCHPVSHYGKSKILAEEAVLSAAGDIPVSIVRPSAVYGPRDRDMYKYFKLIMSRLHLVIGFKPKKLNLIHVHDLVRGIIKTAETDAAVGEIFNLGGTRAYSNEEIGNTIARVIDRTPLRIRIPHSLVYAIGAIAEVFGKISHQQVFFNMQKVNEAIQPLWDCSIEKARDLLNFQPEIPLTEGMNSTYQWYVKNKWLP